MRRWTVWVADPRNRPRRRPVLDVWEELGSARRGRQKDDHGGDRLKYLTKLIVPRKAFGLKDLERYKR